MVLLKLSLIVLFLFTVSCAQDIAITENDHMIFPLEKKENKNKVIYAVKADGKCAITGLFAYWRMDQEDGHTEKLLSYEEDIYGVKNERRVDAKNWTFNVAKMPKRQIRATAVIDQKAKGSDIKCTFEGVTEIEGVESVLTDVMVNNQGHSVDSIDFYGTRLTDETPVHENFVP